MSNAFQVNAPATEAGLGTFTNTVTTTGNYTLRFKSTIPYLASGSPVQSTLPSQVVTNVTAAADTAGSKNSTWWKFYSACDAYSFYVWYNINSAGVDPAPAGFTAGIEVDGATGATAATLATATIAAINAHAVASLYVVASAGVSGHLIVSTKQYGTSTAAANGTASYGASFSVTSAGSFGVPAGSGLTAKVYNNSVLQATFAFPTPTQPSLGGAVSMAVTAGNNVDLILASLSDADNAANAIKTSINLFQGV